MPRAFFPMALPLLLALPLGARSLAMLEPIVYTVRFPAPETHYAEVEVSVPSEGKSVVELAMPVWTPGSYLVREFSRNVEAVAAKSAAGDVLTVEKTRKNRWRIATRGAARIVASYRLYAREMSVRTDFIDASFALLNGAPTFLSLAPLPSGPAGEHRPHEVRLVLPPQWKVAVSALPEVTGAEVAGGPAHRFRAESFDQLVDSPIYAGNAVLHPFSVGGTPYVVVDEGEQEGGLWDGPRSAKDFARIAEEEAALWRLTPFPRYVLFNLVTESGGGLEHKDSSVLMTSRWRSRTRDGYVDWLGLASHELFHAWNGKRLRPIELGPFDYEEEVYTPSLWAVEGVTAYYEDLLVHRAGLSTRDELLKRLGKQIEEVETTPGAKVQPLADSSRDAWIKYYRRDENSANSSISYYTKGAVVAFLLDARIRQATGGRACLDDALRLAYSRHAGDRGYRPEELRAAFQEVAGVDLSSWLDGALLRAEPLDYAQALQWFGLRFSENEAGKGKEDKAEAGEKSGGGKERAGWLGFDPEAQGGRLVVTVVKRDTPAYRAGVNVGDEVLAIGDYRVPPDGWKERLKAYRPGDKETLLVARRERLLRLPIQFGEAPKAPYKLEVDPKATPEQRTHLTDWLRSSVTEEAKPAPAG
jgi:predicted metalloprotease with PDZ domain